MSIQITRPWLRPFMAGLVFASITLGSIGCISVINRYANSCLSLFEKEEWHEQMKKGKQAFADTCYAKAEEHFRQSLAYSHKDLESERLSSVWLGSTLFEEQQEVRALPFLQRGLQMTRAQFGNVNTDTADVILLNARAQERAGNYTEAEKLYLEAIAIGPKVRTVMDIEFSRATNCYGNLLCTLGRFEEAQPLIEDMFEFNKTYRGLHNTNTLESIRCLAWIYAHQKRYDESLDLYNQAIELSRVLYGEKTQNTALCYIGKANMLDAQGDHEYADDLLVGSIDLLKQCIGRNEITMIDAKRSLGQSHAKRGRSDAPLLLQECFFEAINRYGMNHPVTKCVYREFELSKGTKK